MFLALCLVLGWDVRFWFLVFGFGWIDLAACVLWFVVVLGFLFYVLVLVYEFCFFGSGRLV